MKDYFGKRSLLVGMGEEHLYLTSAPFFELQTEQPAQEGGDEEQDENWKVKYQAEWLTSKYKMFF